MPEKRPFSKTQEKATKNYNKTHYDDIKLRVKKGQKDQLKEEARAAGLTLNSYLLLCIEHGKKML